ncbi:DMSO/TMAO reductase YedYZ, molybdopterin-dependent catalytic subunit [Bryocella elongata]|uniref:DMSO/TMAO reductase YedYZ, molybdopterin-dependent catalytic subunit n=1 Tax=Bryocella elongata TaxID=863522 RepID=A0A1H5WTY4_9BACT|nr:molybdopterin-dependent oxidoreductase [Bryocella elongata]SEG03039.1 DMSO/TMAO reductase YedYZ, molybdopterin-dependent catalytic subunit [Bryocella elongata]
MKSFSRRRMLTAGIAAAAGAAGVIAAPKVVRRFGLAAPDCAGPYGPGEALTYAASRIIAPNAMAREFSRSWISKEPFANSLYGPIPAEFTKHKAEGFANWKIAVGGMVMHPTEFSVPDLKQMGRSSQITEVACEEGWSYIAEWIGTPLALVLQEVQPLAPARYLVYTSMRDGLWDSIDMHDARHPQTLLTWGMNDGDLPFGFGGPLRMRLPKQLGYRNVKYVHKMVFTDSLKGFGKGMGSANPEYGYSWYAGI